MLIPTFEGLRNAAYTRALTLIQRPQYSMLAKKETVTKDTLFVSISRDAPAVVEEVGPIDSPRLVLSFTASGASYAFQVHYTTVESGDYDEESVKARIDQLLPTSGYVLCPGLKEYDLHFKSKNLRKWSVESI